MNPRVHQLRAFFMSREMTPRAIVATLEREVIRKRITTREYLDLYNEQRERPVWDPRVNAPGGAS